MSRLDSTSPEFQSLLSAACQENFTQEQLAKLEDMASDASARKLLVDYFQLDGELQRIIRQQCGAEKCLQLIGILPAEAAAGDSLQSPPFAASPTFGFFGSAYHGTVNFFSQEIPFACLVTTIIMGVAGVIGLNTTKEHYTQLPWKSVASADRSYAVPESDGPDKANAAVKEEKMQWVGQITGKVDCVWADDSTAPVWHKFGMNDKFELKSGLVEITYYSGAKVILQGPCTYEVDSAAGGYLSLGKLTARVENKGAGGAGRGAGDAVASGQWPVASDAGESGEGRGESEKAEGGGRKAEETAKTEDRRPKAEGRNPEIPKSQNPPVPPSPLSTLHTPLFAVRTPTAVVTDLGTEFGIEVDGSGDTISHVFAGIVQMADAKGGYPLRLTENQSARVVAGAKGEVRVSLVVAEEAASDKYVRFEAMVGKMKAAARGEDEKESAYIRAVLADKPLGYWPLNEPTGSLRFEDRSGNDFEGFAMRRVDAGSAGPFGGRSQAVLLEGGGYIDIGRQDRFALANGFTVEAWAWIDSPADLAPILSTGNRASTFQANGWSLAYVPRPNMFGNSLSPCFCLTTHLVEQGIIPNIAPPIKQWMHLAVAFDQNNIRKLYLNGEHQVSLSSGKPAKTGTTFVAIGYSSNNWGQYWHGRLAHVAVYPHVLSEQQIQRHYLQSDDSKERMSDGKPKKKGGPK